MKFLFPIFLVCMVVLMRFLPHLPNFTPVVGIALFSGVYLSRKYALTIPFAGMVISDYFIGFHDTILYVYGALAIIGLIGLWLHAHNKTRNVIGSAFLSSILFYLITNFGVWTQGWYGYTLTGLIDSYVMGIPFFKYTLLGDLFYTGLFFGSYSFITHYLTRKDIRYII